MKIILINFEKKAEWMINETLLSWVISEDWGKNTLLGASPIQLKNIHCKILKLLQY